jgi:hypothetical protein
MHATMLSIPATPRSLMPSERTWRKPATRNNGQPSGKSSNSHFEMVIYVRVFHSLEDYTTQKELIEGQATIKIWPRPMCFRSLRRDGLVGRHDVTQTPPPAPREANSMFG